MSLNANCRALRPMLASKNSAATPSQKTTMVALRPRYALHRTGCKKTISYSAKEVSGRVCHEVEVGFGSVELDCWGADSASIMASGHGGRDSHRLNYNHLHTDAAQERWLMLWCCVLLRQLRRRTTGSRQQGLCVASGVDLP